MDKIKILVKALHAINNHKDASKEVKNIAYDAVFGIADFETKQKFNAADDETDFKRV